MSWSLSTRPDAELVNTMLDNAVETLNAGERPVIHSDRGGHYRWPGWLERVNAAGLIRSMSRKGCSPDNAACEGFFGRLKTEIEETGSLFFPRTRECTPVSSGRGVGNGVFSFFSSWLSLRGYVFRRQAN